MKKMEITEINEGTESSLKFRTLVSINRKNSHTPSCLSLTHKRQLKNFYEDFLIFHIKDAFIEGEQKKYNNWLIRIIIFTWSNMNPLRKIRRFLLNDCKNDRKRTFSDTLLKES